MTRPREMRASVRGTPSAPRCAPLAAAFVIFATALLIGGRPAPVQVARAAVPNPTPVASFKVVPAQVLVGDTFTFKIQFNNAPGSDPGFAPFVDIAMDSRGADDFTNNLPCDGISFEKAELVDVSGAPNPLTNTASAPPAADCTTWPTTVSHPFAGPVMLPAAGWQLNTVELPFPNFNANEPTVTIKVTARVHQFADVTQVGVPKPQPVQICIRGGFRGTTPQLNNPVTQDNTTNAVATWICESVVPVVFKVKKTYLGRDDEAVPGPNFTGVFPIRFKIKVNIADGQVVDRLHLADSIPSNLQYADNVTISTLDPSISLVPVVSGGAFCSGQMADIGPAPPPGGTLDVWLCFPVTGTTAKDDVTVYFDAYVPKLDADGQPVIDASCDPATVTNDVLVEGSWFPPDPRDNLSGFIWNINASAKTKQPMTAKCLAVQKSVANTSRVDPDLQHTIPGDVLKYTVTFQISDYLTFGDLILRDVVAQGQQLYLSSSFFWPQLTVKDRFGTTSGQLPPGSYVVDPRTDVSCLAGSAGTLQNVVGGTLLTFNVSQLMGPLLPEGPWVELPPPVLAFRHNAGVLTGGYAVLPSPPFGPLNSGPATGTLTFYARVDDAFQFPANLAPSSDGFVDKLDPINNCVTLTGRILQNSKKLPPNTIGAPTGVVVSDGGESQAVIAHGEFTKSIVARNGDAQNLVGTPPMFAAKDTITYELTYTPLPSSDAEHVVIRDWLPAPVLTAGSLVAGGVCAGTNPPPTGTWCYTTGGLTLGSGFPAFSFDTVSNSLTFDFGSFNDPWNASRAITVRFTLPVTDQPFADGLHLANVARECETNSFGKLDCQVAVAELKLSAPVLRIRKGVIAADNPGPNPDAVFSPPLPSSPTVPLPRPPVGLITPPLTGVPGPFATSDITSGVDAGDTVTFAIVVVNDGSGLYGAHDVKILDTLPTGLTLVPGSVVVTYGDGTTVIPSLGDLFAPFIGLELLDSGAQGALAPDQNAPAPSTDPRSVALITFQARLEDHVTPGCYTNKAEILNYASFDFGPNFVPTGFGGPLSDTATVCVRTSATKSIKTTSEAHTADTTADTNVTPSDPRPLAIGEIVRYRVQVKLPEGDLNGLDLKDILPSGLSYLPDGTARWNIVVSPGGGCPFTPTGGDDTTVTGITPSCPLPGGGSGAFSCASPGQAPSFSLGTIVNGDRDPDGEFVVLEFNAIVCNIPANQDTDPPAANRVEVSVGGQLDSTSPSKSTDPVWTRIVEPNLTVSKTPVVVPGGFDPTLPNCPPVCFRSATITYTVSIANTGSADAFDAVVTDTTVPSSNLNPLSGSVLISAPTVSPSTACSVQSGLGTWTALCPQIASGAAPITITYTVRVVQMVLPPPPVTDCQAPVENTVVASWTSLPGSGTPLTVDGSTSSAGNSGTIDGERGPGGNGANDYDSPLVDLVVPALYGANGCSWGP